MRILEVVHGFPPEAAGGAEIYAQAVAQELARETSDEVVVLAREARPDRPEFSLREEARGRLRLVLLNHTYREVRRFQDTYRDARVTAALATAIDAMRPDVAHLHHLTNLSTDLVDLLADRGIPIVFTLHDYWLLCQRGQLLDLEIARCPGPSRAGCARCLGLAAGGGALPHSARRLLRRAEERLPEALAQPLLRAARRAGPALARLGGGAGRGGDEVEIRLARVRSLAGRVALFLAPSRTLRDRFLAFGIPEDRIAVHPYGHDHAPFRHRPRGASQRLRIGFVGSLMVSKAPHLVLEAFAGLPPGRATLHLYGATSAYHGDDGYRRVLEPLLAQPGVRWEGPVDHAALPALQADLDVVVVPSIWIENAPLVISEAFLAGLPVVCSDLGGMAEMVEDGVCGLRFRPGDAADLRRKLLRLLEEPDLLARLRRGIPPVRAIGDDVRALRARFTRLAGERDAGRTAAGAARLAAVVVHHETPEQTLRCARALAGSRRGVDEIVVVDNGSRDGSAAAIARELPALTLLRCDANLGFAAGANRGIRHALAAGADLVLLVNSDARVDADCIERLEHALAPDPSIGIVGPAILADGEPERIESLGLAFSTRTGRFREQRPDAARRGPGRAVDAVSGCAMLIRRELLERVGLFDESYFFGFEDLDLCLRARAAGFRSEIVPEASVRHEGHATIGRRSPERLYYAARNHLRLARRARASGRAHAALRQLAVAGLNVAHALRGAEVARLPGLRAVLRGCRDAARGRSGKADHPSSFRRTDPAFPVGRVLRALRKRRAAARAARRSRAE